MIDDSRLWPDNGNARQGRSLAGVRTVGRISHPAIAKGPTDAPTSAGPVAHDTRLGLRAQGAACGLTGGRAAQSARFPGL